MNATVRQNAASPPLNFHGKHPTMRRLFWSSGASISPPRFSIRSEEHTSELQSRLHLVCRLLLEKKKNIAHNHRVFTETDAERLRCPLYIVAPNGRNRETDLDSRL